MFWPALRQNWDNFETTFGQLLDNFGTTFRQLWNNFLTALGKLRNNFGTTLRPHQDNFQATFRQPWHNFETTLGQLWGNFGIILGQLWDNFGTTLWHHGDYVVTIGRYEHLPCGQNMAIFTKKFHFATFTFFYILLINLYPQGKVRTKLHYCAKLIIIIILLIKMCSPLYSDPHRLCSRPPHPSSSPSPLQSITRQKISHLCLKTTCFLSDPGKIGHGLVCDLYALVITNVFVNVFALRELHSYTL